jgi:spore maturation protein CgeB
VTSILTVNPGAPYATADVYNGIVPELRRLGVEVHEYDLESRLDISRIFLNTTKRFLQRRGETPNKPTDVEIVYGASKDILERALRWEVDGVLVFSGMFTHPDPLVLLRRAHVRTAAVLSESPYDDAKQAKHFLPYVDVAWTNERSSVPILRQANPNVNYLPHAFSPEVHYPYGVNEADVPTHDVVFVGSLFAERVDLLSQVNWDGIDLGLYGNWLGLPSRHKLRKFVRGGVVDNRGAAALYRKARIGLNLYRESIGWGKDAPRITHAESMNPRAYELAACGCFQISQDRSEGAEILGNNIATFGSAAQLEFAIRHHLKFPDQRLERANAALQRVQPHTFAARARTILEDLERAEWPVQLPKRQPLLVAV